MQAKKAKNKNKLSEKNLQIYLCVVVEKDLESKNKSKIFKLFYDSSILFKISDKTIFLIYKQFLIVLQCRLI